MDGDWERTAEAFKGGTMSQRQRDKRQANLKPLQTSGHGNKEERSREEKKDQENGISGKLSSFPGVFFASLVSSKAGSSTFLLWRSF